MSDYPVGAALMALPFYAPSIVCGVSPNSRVFSELEKVSAATIVALSAMLLYMAAARVTAEWMAMMLTLVYAFGTSSLSVSSQALWQHGPAQLALAAAIYCLIRARDDPRWAGYAGLPLAFEVITRPADALIAAPLGLYVLISYRREVWRFIASAIPPLLFQLWYSAAYFGSPLRIQFFTEPTAGGRPGGGAERIVDDLAREWIVGSGTESRPRTALLFADFHFLNCRIGAGMAQERRRAAALPGSRRDFEHHARREMAQDIWRRVVRPAPARGPDANNGIGAVSRSQTSIRNRRALAVAFAVLGAWSITAHASGAFIGYRGWNQWALNEPDKRLWLWGDNPVVDPFRSTFDSTRIALGHRATSRNSPDLLEGGLVVLKSPPHDAAPGARVHVSVRATNIGKAVWLGGRSADEHGIVSLGWEWKRDGKVIGSSEARRELHLDVFPGDSMDLEASASAPDAPGLYVLEISLAAEVSQTDRSIGPLVAIPITVAGSAAAPGGVR